MERTNKSPEGKPRVLIVDDLVDNVDVLAGILDEDYELKVALNGLDALRVANSDPPPDLILLDVMMPDMNGYDVCRVLKENLTTRKIPVIFVTALGETEDESEGFAVGAVDYLTKPVSPPIVQARVRSHLALYDRHRLLEDNVRARTAELAESRLAIIQRLGKAAEYKDNETGLHTIRMSNYARILASSIGLGDDEVELIFLAAPMHDIGKIGIPDRIIQKPGKLNDEEWAVMKSHTTIGAEIIGEHASDLLKAARTVALQHHEKWDGTGYPGGLTREETHPRARIVTVADVFDALTTVRSYKPAWPVEKAFAHLRNLSGSNFDPELVEAFLDVKSELLEIKTRYDENEKLNVT